MTKEDLKKYYQRKNVTSTYSQQRLATNYRREKRKKEVAIFLELLNKKDNEKVLEIGPSDGMLTQYLGKVVAIDTSKEMLKITKKKNPQAKVLEADMFKLPFKKSSFNKVVTMRVWNHLDILDLHLALNEAKKILKKKGVIVFDIEEKNFLRKTVNLFYKKIFGIKGFKVYQYSLDEISSILESEGFNIEKARYLKHKIGNQIIIKARKE